MELSTIHLSHRRHEGLPTPEIKHVPATAPEAESVQVRLDVTVNYLLKCFPGGTSDRRTCLPMQET